MCQILAFTVLYVPHPNADGCTSPASWSVDLPALSHTHALTRFIYLSLPLSLSLSLLTVLQVSLDEEVYQVHAPTRPRSHSITQNHMLAVLVVIKASLSLARYLSISLSRALSLSLSLSLSLNPNASI